MTLEKQLSASSCLLPVNRLYEIPMYVSHLIFIFKFWCFSGFMESLLLVVPAVLKDFDVLTSLFNVSVILHML